MLDIRNDKTRQGGCKCSPMYCFRQEECFPYTFEFPTSNVFHILVSAVGEPISERQHFEDILYHGKLTVRCVVVALLRKVFADTGPRKYCWASLMFPITICAFIHWCSADERPTIRYTYSQSEVT